MSKNSNTLTSNASAILESCSSLGFLLSVSYFYNVDKFILLFSLNCSIVSFRAFLYFFIVLAVTEVTTEVRSEETEKDIAVAKASEEKTDKEDNRSADNETASKQEEKSEQNDEPEQKAPASGNKEGHLRHSVGRPHQRCECGSGRRPDRHQPHSGAARP